MQFRQKVSSKRSNEFFKEFLHGVWNPKTKDWHDIIEDLLYISRRRINNKFVLFRLQLSILTDIIRNVEGIDAYKRRLYRLTNDKERNLVSEKSYNDEVKFINSEIYGFELINRALKEVVDGIVWRLFKYNRAILYLLADKEPIDSLRLDKGLIETLYELGDIFLGPGNIAIINDISNFLRIGDITKIENDGNIELIEVKSSRKQRGRRIQRQKQNMCEVVEFINTGYKEYDDTKLLLLDSNIRQVHYLQNLLDSIKRSQVKGYDSILIGDYLILEISNHDKIDNPKKMIEYFEDKHELIRKSWEKKSDVLIDSFFVEKLEYSKNYIPYSILPFHEEICANIIMGKVMIHGLLNVSEIFRKIEKAGWEIVNSLLLKTATELNGLSNNEKHNIPILEIRKENYILRVPSNYLYKLIYELWSPGTMIKVIEETYVKRQSNNYDGYLINFLDDLRIWK
jgi:hypothetical protein